MKTLKYIFCSLIFSLGTLSFVSCDKNGDDPNDKISEGWSETANTMTYKITYGTGLLRYVYVWEFEFAGDSCTKARCVVTFPNNMIAAAVYAALDTDEQVNATYALGNKIEFNFDDEYDGMSKTDLKTAINAGGGGWL